MKSNITSTTKETLNADVLLDDMRAMITGIKSLIVVISDVDLDNHQPEIIGNYFGILADLAYKAEHCWFQLARSYNCNNLYHACES